MPGGNDSRNDKPADRCRRRGRRSPWLEGATSAAWPRCSVHALARTVRTTRSEPGSGPPMRSAAESEVEDQRADYAAKLAVSRAKRARAVRRSAELLAAVAVFVGDDNDTARLLEVPLHQVHAAHTLR